MVLRLISCSPRRPGLFATVTCGVASANLMPASGHQDHTTSPSASKARSSFAPPRASVTIASRPSVERDGGSSRVDLGKSRSGIFLREGLDRPATDLPVGQSMHLEF